MEYKKVKLKNIANITMGQSPKGSSYNDKGEGRPFLQGNKTFGRLYPFIDKWTTEPTKIGKKGTVLMSVRAPVGDLNIANQDVCIGRGLCSIEMKNGNNEYLYYLLKNTIKEIKIKSTGTVFASINKKELEEIKVIDFDRKEQIKIAKVLSKIDKKIELNNQINDNLYELSYEVFKNFKEEIKKQPIKEFCNFKELGSIIMGQSPKGESYNFDNIGIPLINGAADYQNGYLKPQKYTSMPTKVCKKGDLIFCIRATIGLLVVSNEEYCLGRGVAGIINTYDYYKEYVYHLINNSINEFKRMATGSVIVGISRDDIGKMKVSVPSEEQIIKFHTVQKPIFDKIENIREENKTLVQLRDTLLPKLMNGEIDLDKIEI